MREMDALSGDQRARLGRGEAFHLGLALLAVAAVREIVVEIAGMGHELGDPRRERAQVLEHALTGPVGIRPRLAHEVIRGADAVLLRPGPDLRVLRAHGDLQRSGEEAEEVEEGAVSRHVVMAVEVRGKAPHEPLELLDLVPHLDAGLVRYRALGLAARLPHELSLPGPGRGRSVGGGRAPRLTMGVVLVTIPV